MGDQALGELEKRLGRTLRPGKRGRPRSEKNDPRQLEFVYAPIKPRWVFGTACRLQRSTAVAAWNIA
jgi:hypothetical protein